MAKKRIIKRNQLTTTQIKLIYKRVFSSSDGQVILEDLSNKFLGPIYTPGMSALDMAHAAGARDLIADHIGTRVGAHMDKIIVMDPTDEED
jgi:hypothetical protein